ncbi:MAG: hypothetical protein MI919_08590 [Holophagales bacterium]|nr:hypothetical protein [Holophagales bacterium]
MPLHDPQFWLVTAAALAALRLLIRHFLPASDGAPSCGSCATGAAPCARPGAETGSGHGSESPLRVLPR